MARTIWWAALIAGCSYMLPVLMDWEGPAVTAWKGTAVGLLALWAGVQARDTNGWLITAVLGLGATGDVVLNIYGLKVGAVLFAMAHLVAIALYLLNRRVQFSGSQQTLGAVTIPAAIIITICVLGPPGEVLESLGTGMAREGGSDIMVALIYSAIVASMASAAWSSRFPRYRTGIGAMLFLASDLLIFAQMGVLAGASWPRLLIWPLYFAAQALIAWGVVTTLRSEKAQP